MLTFTTNFKSCSRDSCTALAIMTDVIWQPKIAMPGLKTVCYRQDNAGCYHCGTTLVCSAALGHEKGVKIRCLDFSDSQKGKAACDWKAATITIQYNTKQILLSTPHGGFSETSIKKSSITN